MWVLYRGYTQRGLASGFKPGPPCRGPLDKHSLGGFNQPLADKQTNKQIISLNAYLLACLPEGGQVLAHSGWVMGLEEKLSKGTETTQEIHEGL